MRTITPQTKTVEQPVQFLERQHDCFIADVGRGFETFGLEALEPKAKAVAFPISNLHAVAGFVEEDEKHRVEYGHFYVELDQRRKAVDGFSKVDGLGVEVDFFDFSVGTHHEVLAPEKNREHSIGDQLIALKEGFMERLPSNSVRWFGVQPLVRRPEKVTTALGMEA